MIFSRRAETTVCDKNRGRRPTTTTTTIWIFVLLLSIVEKKGTAGKERTKKKKKRERARRCSSSLSLSLFCCAFRRFLSSRAVERVFLRSVSRSFVRSFDICLLTKQQQLFLFENAKTQNNAKRSPRRRNTSRNSRTKRAGRICSSY